MGFGEQMRFLFNIIYHWPRLVTTMVSVVHASNSWPAGCSLFSDKLQKPMRCHFRASRPSQCDSMKKKKKKGKEERYGAQYFIYSK